MAITINPNDAFSGDQGASDLQGRLSRAQWEDWKTRFRPYVTRLSDMATDNNAPGLAAEQAGQAMNGAFTASTQGLDMQRAGMGVSNTPRQQAAQDRRMALAEGAATVDARNEARLSARDRQQQVLAGGLSMDTVPTGGR